MNNHEAQFHCGIPGNPTFHTSPFSAFHFLRNYNSLLSPETSELPSKHLLNSSRLLSDYQIQSSNNPEKMLPLLYTDIEKPRVMLQQKPLAYWQQGTIFHTDVPNSRTNVLSPCGTIFGTSMRRQRGEKKAIPDEQKDDKYFERRRRNNQAAKKSRDARKLREDQVALKAAILEHENAILRAQVLTLRDEATMLRQLLMDKKVSEF